MKQIHNIKVSVFVKQEEDYDLIKSKLLSLFSFEVKKQFSESVATTFFDRKMKILEVQLEKQKEIRDFVDGLLKDLSDEQRLMVVRQVESRVDEDLHFFLRLDKKKLIGSDEWWVTDDGDCFHLNFCLAAYPKKREIGIEIVKGIFASAE